MPWIKHINPPGEVPAHYKMPISLSDDTVLGRNNEYAKEQRKKCGQLREELLKLQKECEQEKNIEAAKFCRNEAAEILKQFRGWDGAIKVIEENDFWHKCIAEQIAAYVDRAFVFMELQCV